MRRLEIVFEWCAIIVLAVVGIGVATAFVVMIWREALR